MISVDQAQLRMLLELGYLNGAYGFLNEALVIFNGLRAVRPKAEEPCIGLAVSYLNAAKAEEAIEVMRQFARHHETSDLFCSMLGMALKLGKHTYRAEHLLEQVRNHGQQAVALAMADHLLHEIRRPRGSQS